MRSRTLASAIVLCAAATIGLAAAAVQDRPQAVMILNRMDSAYRSLASYRDAADITRTVDKKKVQSTLTIASRKPDRYLLDLKGDGLNDTQIVSDGTTLIAYRPDRNAYTKSKAPVQIIHADFLDKVDMPSLGARIISQLLTGAVRRGEIGKLLLNAKVTGPDGYGDKLAYTFSFPFGEDTEARVMVTSDDYLVREVRVVKGSEVIWREVHKSIELDRSVPDSTFKLTLPDNARLVYELPALPNSTEVASSDSGPDSGSPAGQAHVTRPDPEAALALYRTNGCGGCHSGGGAPDLSREGSRPGRTAAWLADQIRDPASHRSGSRMPGFAGSVSDSDIQTLAAYLASLK